MEKYTVNEILENYTKGTFDVERANAELKAANAGFSLDPYKHYFSPDEIVNGSAGLLFTGTGYPDKVKIVNGELEYEINQVSADGTTNMYCACLVAGKLYEVKGKKLVEC